MWIFGLGSDLYDETIGTNGISRMSEYNQLWAIGQNPIRAQNKLSTDVNRHLIFRAKTNINCDGCRKENHVIIQMNKAF